MRQDAEPSTHSTNENGADMSVNNSTRLRQRPSGNQTVPDEVAAAAAASDEQQPDSEMTNEERIEQLRQKVSP